MSAKPRLGAADEASRQLRALLANASQGHRQHHDQSQPAAQAHLLEPADRVQFEAKRDVPAAIDPFDRRPAVVFPLPCITRPVDGGKHAPIRLAGNAESRGHGALPHTR